MTLNLADKTAVIDGKPVELPSKEFDLLALLIENQGNVLKKSYLFGTVWGSDSDSELQTLTSAKPLLHGNIYHAAVVFLFP